MILLVTPNSKKVNYANTDEFTAIQPNLYMAMLESHYRSQGYKCECLNAEAEGLNNEQLAEIATKWNPLLVIIVCSGANPAASTMSMLGAIDFMKYYKGKASIYGGHPSVLPERTFRETGANVISGSVFSGCPDIDYNRLNLNKYRGHNWHCFGDLENRSPYGVVYTSLGCPHSCEFCCVNNLFGGKTYRMRDMNRVIFEIDAMVRQGVKHLKIMDELFITKHPRIDQFCDLLEQRGYDLNMWCFARVDSVDERILSRLKKVGLNWVAYGFESADQETLDKSGKGISLKLYDDVVNMTRNAGLNIIADVIAGFENDNYDTLKATYDFLVKYNFEFVNMYPLFAYPGTKLYEKIEEPKDWSEYSLFGYNCKPMNTKYLEAREVLKWRDKAYYDYHNRKEYLDMMENKFGVVTREHIIRMLSNPIKRKICGD